jgi:hypothetical protein
MNITCDGSLYQCNAMNRVNLRLNNRWQNLKDFILDNGIKDNDPPPADDLNTYQVGYNDALNNMLNHMNFLEEK